MPPSRSRARKAGGGGEGVGEELRLNLVWERGRGANRKAAPYLQTSLNRVTNNGFCRPVAKSMLLFYFTAMLPLGPFPANGHRASADRHRNCGRRPEMRPHQITWRNDFPMPTSLNERDHRSFPIHLLNHPHPEPLHRPLSHYSTPIPPRLISSVY